MRIFNDNGFEECEIETDSYEPSEEEIVDMEQEWADKLISQRGSLTELHIHNGLCICNCPGLLKSYMESCDIKSQGFGDSTETAGTLVTYTCRTCGLKREVEI